MFAKKKIILFAGLAVAVVLIVIAFVLYSHSSDYVNLSRFQSESDKYYNRQVSVSGRVAPGSVNWDDAANVMKFELTEGAARVAVVYNGLVPEKFKPGTEIVVNGRYGADNVIQAASFGEKRSVCNICH